MPCFTCGPGFESLPGAGPGLPVPTVRSEGRQITLYCNIVHIRYPLLSFSQKVFSNTCHPPRGRGGFHKWQGETHNLPMVKGLLLEGVSRETNWNLLEEQPELNETKKSSEKKSFKFAHMYCNTRTNTASYMCVRKKFRLEFKSIMLIYGFLSDSVFTI